MNNNTWSAVQLAVGVTAMAWFISWFSGFMNMQNSIWYWWMLLIIAIASLVLIIKIKSIVRIIWALVFTLAVIMLVIMFLLRDFTIQF